MLIVVFGAGATFDSDPARPVDPTKKPDWPGRPPVARHLFDVTNLTAREAATLFSRARATMLAADREIAAGANVEELLQALQDEADSHEPARAAMLAIRFYLQRICHEIPSAWSRDCAGGTNYVAMLDELARFSSRVGEGLCLITFNYDLLLDQACHAVFGLRLDSMASYHQRADLHLFKPHGAVNWAQLARWQASRIGDGKDPARIAMCDDAANVNPVPGEFEVRAPTATVQSSGPGNEWRTYIPAIAIPVERKPALVMPTEHVDSMKADLAQASGLVSVGWRAREDHFLRLLADQLPSRRLPLFVVAEQPQSVEETLENLRWTGRFDRFDGHTGGFTSFVQQGLASGAKNTTHGTDLKTMLRQPSWRPMTPGGGLDSRPNAPSFTRSLAPYRRFDHEGGEPQVES
jgi:hypothetical protein